MNIQAGAPSPSSYREANAETSERRGRKLREGAWNNDK